MLELFLWLGMCIADSAQFTRFDRQNAFDKYLQSLVFESTTPNNVNVSLKASDEVSESFKIMFECGSEVPTQDCRWARESFESAATKISQVLEISKTIVVKAKFYSFCKSQKSGNCDGSNNTLGRASGSSFFPIRLPRGAGVYLCPQSLIKQSIPDLQHVSLSQVDIFAEFNYDFPFYHKSSGLEIQSSATDFEFVVAHELTHGLGFESGWVNYAEYYKNSVSRSDYIAPLPFTSGTSEISAVASNFSPLMVFDSYLVSGSEKFTTIDKKLSEFKTSNIKLGKFLKELERDSEMMNAALKAMKLSTNPSSPITFEGETLEKIELHSPSLFVQGTSISHISSNNSNSKDFLMVPTAIAFAGRTLSDIMTSTGSTEIYGPKTKLIMTTIGWSTKDKQSAKVMQIVPNFGNDNSGERPSLIASIIVFLSLLNANILF